VVSDVLSIGRGASANGRRPMPETTVYQVSGDFVAPHYVRFTVRDRAGILAQVSAAFARYDINIEAVLQLPHFKHDRLPFAMTLEACSESALDRALADVAGFDFNVQPPLSLPMFM
jgi:homoserine dehydrogenase